MKRKATIKIRFLKNGRIALYFRGRKIFDARDMESVRAFREGFGA